MNRHESGLLYMLAFCLLLALVMLLKGSPPPPKQATVSEYKPETQQERNARQSK